MGTIYSENTAIIGTTIIMSRFLHIDLQINVATDPLVFKW